jgi:hypothetical protein
VKRYLVFVYGKPLGGSDDVLGDFDNHEEINAALDKARAEGRMTTDDHLEVLDMVEREWDSLWFENEGK